MRIIFLLFFSCTQASNFILKKESSFFLDGQKQKLKRISWYSNLNLVEDLYYVSVDDTLNQYLDPIQEHLFAPCLEKILIFIYSTSHLIGEKSFLERNLKNSGGQIFKLGSLVSVFKNQVFYEELNLFRYQIFGFCSSIQLKNIIIGLPDFKPTSF